MSFVRNGKRRTQGQSNPTVGAGAGGRPPISDDKAIRMPSPPLAYDGLQVGPQLNIEYEPNTTIPVDGSDQLLRSLSPFIFRVEPPLVFGNEPAFVDQTNDKGLGTYSNALRTSRGFENARGAIGRQFAFGNLGNSSSAAQYISKNGQPQAKKSNNPENKLVDGTPPDSLGQPAIADLYTAVDISMQLQAALNTPPLVLLINPQSISINFSKIQQFTDRTRHGYVFQAWGEEQPKMTISARCGAFYSGQRGVQFASKRDSASWQNLMNALTFYRNNGYIYDTVGGSNAHHFVGTLSIHYDGWIYYGNMESFSYTYDEQNQLGGMTFDMEFTVSTMVDSSQSNQVVAPMRAPTRSVSDFRLARRRDLNQEGTLSIGLGGTVNDRLYSDGSRAPRRWDSNVGQNVQAGASQGAAPTPSRGFRGFQVASAPEEDIPIALAEDPEPFKVS